MSTAAPRIKEIVTPEGVPLRMQLASAGDRVGAVVVDYLIMFFSIIAIVLATIPLWMVSTGVSAILISVLVFVIRYFYFILFEVRWQGRTPGKKMTGIRVIDRSGGPLRADSIIARNLTRDFEILYPLLFLFLAPAFSGWVGIASVSWLIVILCFPLFNKDRLRLGDLVGGTLVVAAPRAVLLRDLMSKERTEGLSRYAFTREQLDLYGVYELQVLERLLRRQKGNTKTLKEVCSKIKAKIAWDRNRWNVDTRRFLEDFYAAQRARLEHRMQLGDRQERKKEGKLEQK